jgi:vancomycin permeability regulator SanA
MPGFFFYKQDLTFPIFLITKPLMVVDSKKIYKILVFLTLLICFPFWIFSVAAFGDTKKNEPRLAIVLGAGLWRDWPSPILQRRLDSAVKLFHEGKVNHILVSGDNSRRDYDEPTAMKRYLIEKGILPKDITEDFAGRRTIDTCWRAKNVFKVDEAYLISQSFHLPRGYFLCETQGIKTIPISSENTTFSTTLFGTIREYPASWLSLKEVVISYEPEIQSDGRERDLSEI